MIGVALAAGLLLSGCKPKADVEEAPTVTVQVGAAENGPIQLKVIADAVLYPRDQAAIVPKVVAPIKKFYVERGSRVKEGQLLAELESQDLAGALEKYEKSRVRLTKVQSHTPARSNGHTRKSIIPSELTA